MVLDSSLLNTQDYKVGIKGKVEQSRERSGAPLRIGVVAVEKEAFGSPSTTVANLYIYIYIYIYIYVCVCVCVYIYVVNSMSFQTFLYGHLKFS